jgi:hypothetical protein
VKDKDSQLIWEAYRVPTSPERFDRETGARIRTGIDEPGPVAGREGYGFSRFFLTKINDILQNEALDDTEKLKNCIIIRDQAVNILRNIDTIISNIDIDSGITLLCTDITPLVFEEERVKTAIWEKLGKYDPSRVADIDIDMLISHVLGIGLKPQENNTCQAAKDLVSLPVLGKTMTGAVLAVLKKIAQLFGRKWMDPFIEDIEQVQTLDQFDQLDLILLQYQSKALRVGKQFEKWWGRFSSTIMSIVKLATVMAGAATGAVAAPLLIAAKSPDFVRKAGGRLKELANDRAVDRQPRLPYDPNR